MIEQSIVGVGSVNAAGTWDNRPTATRPSSTEVLGIPVSLINLDEAADTIVNWCKRGQSEFVCVRDVHGIMQAQADPELHKIHQRAGMVTPDGMPLVWLARHRGHRRVGRVCGTDLVHVLAAKSQRAEMSHYFYGGKSGVASRMASELVRLYPALKVAGCETPPFAALSSQEDDALVRRISGSGAQVVWVGLSTPKQEYWMADHVGRIPGVVLIGVGAAFDFIAGDVIRAPLWMQRGGLEWLHRFVSEPRRLWRRYLILAPLFLLRLVSRRN